MIEPLTVDDLVWLAGYGDRFEARFSRQNFIEIWRTMITAGTGKMWIAIQDGVFQGVLGLALMNDPNTGELCAAEALWHVLPEHRGKAGLDLYKAAADWSQQNGVHWLLFAEPAETRQGFQAFFKREGFKVAQTIWRKELCK